MKWIKILKIAFCFFSAIYLMMLFIAIGEYDGVLVISLKALCWTVGVVVMIFSVAAPVFLIGLGLKMLGSLIEGDKQNK
jgi:hypothetical protein